MNNTKKILSKTTIFIGIIVIIFYSFGFYEMCIKPDSTNENTSRLLILNLKALLFSVRIFHMVLDMFA